MDKRLADISERAKKLEEEILARGLNAELFSAVDMLTVDACDALDEMSDEFYEVSDQVVIEVGGKRIRFESVDQFADFAAKVMHNDRR